MEEGELMLLYQLINSLKESFGLLKKAYEENNKENFDRIKTALLEAQSKINYLLK